MGYDAVSLIACDTEAATAEQADWLSGACSGNLRGDFARLVDRLCSRLEADAVRIPMSQASYLPERRWRFVPALDCRETENHIETPGKTMRSALLLLEEAERVEASATPAGGPPVWIRWRRQRLSLRRAQGPRRVLPEWWRSEERSSREYWLVEDEQGRSLCLYRSRPPGHEVARSLEIAQGLRFSLDELRYEYPEEQVPHGHSPQQGLQCLTWDAAAERYPHGIPQRVREMVSRELRLIDELDYAPYFLTIYDLVRYAGKEGILCQGRGSAANSAVCFCLGITAVDPENIDLLFERFISSERGEPPDIDVDFEHQRREEVIQYVYRRYGRERAGMTATVIHYRPRSALREAGKALGLPHATLDSLAGRIWGGGSRGGGRGGWPDEARLRALGLDPEHPRLKAAVALAAELVGFPRHMSQHPGGMVISSGRLDETVPIANAAMADRTMIEWDKNDLEDLGMLKVDVLALGMLTCLRKCLDLLARHHGRPLTLASIPAEDPEVYDMLCRADCVGVFQVESRAQMSFLPRMRPRCFYDLVIEVPSFVRAPYRVIWSTRICAAGTARRRSTTRRRNCARFWPTRWACRCSPPPAWCWSGRRPKAPRAWCFSLWKTRPAW